MKTEFGLSDDHIDQIVTQLSEILADTQVLYQKTRHCHWDMEDPRFFFLHKMLEEQYDQLAETADEVAERIRQMGRSAPGTMKKFLALTSLEEIEEKLSGDDMLMVLAQSHEKAMVNLRQTIKLADSLGDPGTSDLLVDALRFHEKTAWILRSHL